MADTGGSFLARITAVVHGGGALIEWQEARERIRQHTKVLESIRVPRQEAFGRFLAADVYSDVDVPPYDKSLVDGYALSADSWLDGRREFEVVEQIMAGQVPRRDLLPGQTARIMTGAPLPSGANAVVMWEQTQPSPCGGALIRVQSEHVHAGQHVMPRGRAIAKGGMVLSVGCPLRSIQIGVLAEIGEVMVPIARPPRVSLIQTGDELAPDDAPLGPGQIRNSNGPMLHAMVTGNGGTAIDLGVARDDRQTLRTAIQQGLEADVLILAGGVSQGDHDFVPAILHELGVMCIFHGVAMRPGKPLWFGQLTRAGDGNRTLVFGLPGNPVSAYVCFRVFVSPTLRGLAGDGTAWNGARHRAILAAPFEHRGLRATFWPAVLQASFDRPAFVTPLPWLGSADPFTLAQANCLLAFPGGNRTYVADEMVEVWPLDE